MNYVDLIHKMVWSDFFHENIYMAIYLKSRISVFLYLAKNIYRMKQIKSGVLKVALNLKLAYFKLLNFPWHLFVLAAKADSMHNSMFNILELHLGKKYDCSLSTSSDLDKDKSCKSFRVYAVLSCCCSVLPHSGVKKLDKY